MIKALKNFNPLVSIVIPVYNGSNYMREAIDSALAQTYKNIEVIVVNDGSTDDTDKIAKSYGNKIRYYKKENGGVATALNLAIKKSKGEYISWLSHDDVYLPEKVEAQIFELLKHGFQKKKCVILYSNFFYINEDSETIGFTEFHLFHEKDKLEYPLYPILKGLVHGCTLLISREYLDSNNFNEKLKTTQDYDLWFRIFPSCNIIFTPKPLICSRVHSDQGSKKINTASSESSDLWIKMVQGVSDKEKIAIDGDQLIFLQKTYEIVKASGYTGAEIYLLSKILKYKNRAIEKIKVSIIIPFHNRVKWTGLAINSAIEQTHKNIEIIVVNDKSTNNIESILSIARQDKRVRLLENAYTRGASGARNTGLDFATGEYIAFLDSDDLFMPEKIELQLRYMYQNNVFFSHTSYKTFNKDLQKNTIINSGACNYTYPEIISGCSIATPTVMIYNGLIRSTGARFIEGMFPGEDICFWIELSKKSHCIGIEDSLALVRIHDNNCAHSEESQAVGVSNILNYAISRCLNKNSATQVLILNSLLVSTINGLYFKDCQTEDESKKKIRVNNSYKYFVLIMKFILRLFLFPLSPRFISGLKKIRRRIWL